MNLSRPSCRLLDCGKGWHGGDVDVDVDADGDADVDADGNADVGGDGNHFLVLDSFCPWFVALCLWLSLPADLLKFSAQASISPKLFKTLSSTFTIPSLTSESN